MATSGTTTFDLPLTDVVEEAFERAGSELRGGYDLRTARRSLNLLLVDWANRGINLWTIATDSITLVPGQAVYAIPDQAVDLLEHVIRTSAGQQYNQTDLQISRISVSTYSTIPNKLTTGRPIQILVQRGVPGGSDSALQVTIWPTPDTSTTYTLVYWYLRRMQDAGPAGSNTQDIPYRFLEPLCAGLAFMIAQKIPEGVSRLEFLEKQYEKAWDRASQEDHEKAPVRFIPRVGFIP
jgi:hypothetical protein